MMRRTGWAWLLGVILGSLGGAGAEEPPALEAKERLYRRTELRNAAGRWITHRLRFPSRCPVCQGAGAIPWSDRGRPVRRECQQCKAKGMWISPPDYRAVYYDMRSPAFQALPDIQRTLEAQYKEASQGRPWPTRIQRYKIRDWELVDATHGLVWFQFDGARSATASRWIWIPDEKVKGKGRWGLHDERADGPWPAPRSSQAGSPAPSPAAWDTVPAEELPRLRAAIAGSTTAFWASEIAAAEGTLRVALEPRHADDAIDLHDQVAPNALALAPRLLEAAGGWPRVETQWSTWWRDADGIVRLKPSWTVTIERRNFEARPWSDLDTHQRMGALQWRRWQHEGWTPWAAKPPAPPSPAPAPEEPTAPEPAPEPEVPPTPAPAPPEAQRTPPPALQSTGRKRAEAGVAKMKELLARARAAHDDGVLAHRSGSHDLWQEKLNEARALLGEIEDVWTAEVLAAMPGRDDGEREELANEHFGSIWDEVYELKSVVRKTSQMK